MRNWKKKLKRKKTEMEKFLTKKKKKLEISILIFPSTFTAYEKISFIKEFFELKIIGFIVSFTGEI